MRQQSYGLTSQKNNDNILTMGLLQEGYRIGKIARRTIVAPVLLTGALALAGCGIDGNNNNTSIIFSPVNCNNNGQQVNAEDVPLYPDQKFIVAHYTVAAKGTDLIVNPDDQKRDINITPSGIDITSENVIFHLSAKPAQGLSNKTIVTVRATCNNN